MAKEAAAKQTRTKRKRRAARRKPEKLVQYFVRVTGWDYYYGLRRGDPKNAWDKYAYEELATLTFSGSLVEPDLPKIDGALMTFSGRAAMLDQPAGGAELAFGSISTRSGELSAYVFIPKSGWESSP